MLAGQEGAGDSCGGAGGHGSSAHLPSDLADALVVVPKRIENVVCGGGGDTCWGGGGGRQHVTAQKAPPELLNIRCKFPRTVTWRESFFLHPRDRRRLHTNQSTYMFTYTYVFLYVLYVYTLKESPMVPTDPMEFGRRCSSRPHRPRRSDWPPPSASPMERPAP